MIVLPWPDKALSPNARVHFHDKRRAVKAYRELAYYLTQKADARPPANYREDGMIIRIDFHPPDKRARDLDNMLASFKAGLDGIADCLCVNDSDFGLWIKKAEPVKGGKVVVTL